MDVSTLSSVVPFEQREIPLRLIMALPREARGPVESELRLLEALEDAVVAHPGSVNDVATRTAQVLSQSVRAGKSVDVRKEAAKAVGEFDSQAVAAVASRLAVAWQKQSVVEEAKASIPATCVAWTGRVQEIADEVAALMAAGADLVADELEARPGGSRRAVDLHGVSRGGVARAPAPGHLSVCVGGRRAGHSAVA